MTSSEREDMSATKKADIHEPPRPRAPEDDTDAASLVGQMLSDRYRVERQLGEGAMGAVYLAEHTLMHKRVAIKVLHAEMSRSAEVVARFEREAIAAGHIEHPNVASASDFGKLSDGSFFLVLEYIEGIGLRDALEQYGHLPQKRALHIAHQVAKALVRAHELGIVHRDLKPENVMLVDRGGDPDFVKVLDFGIARVPIGELSVEKKGTAAALTRAGMVYGTPEYMAPEQALGQEVDPRADFYALGIMLYEMLTGERPFAAESKVLLLGMHVTAPVPPMRERAPKVTVAAEVEGFVRHLLAKDANERPVDAHEVEAQLAALIASNAAWVPSVRPPPASRSLGSVAGGEATHARAQAETILADAAHIETPFGRVAKKHLLMGAGGLGLLGLIGIPSLFLVLRGPKADEPHAVLDAGPSALVTTATAAPTQTAEPTRKERSLADALRLLEKGELEAGRAALAKTGTAYDAPAVQRAVAIGCFDKGRVNEALVALSNYATTNQEEALAEPFRTSVVDAAKSSKDTTSLAAFGFLEGNPSPAAADMLYELTLPPGTQTAITRAEKALRSEAMRNKASKSLLVVLSLKDAGQDCEAVKYFDDAAKYGDARALPYLELLEPLKSVTWKKVPGHYKPIAVDAYACLRKDGALARAIAAIKHRSEKTHPTR